jgi:nifR3 family TIM-barrel protein
MTALALPRSGPTIGAQTLASPFLQAALSGYSDWPMRTLARRFGAAYTLAEVMIDRFVNEVRGTGRTGHHFHVTKNDHPVGAQLMGADPAAFGPAAQRLVAAGFDVIDINFGCPVKSALGGCRGGYHLSQPDVALEIVSRVRAVVPAPLPVTLKMRRGIDDSPQSRDRFFEILDGAFAHGVSAVTVHGRTVEQKYRGPSDWNFLRSVKQHVGEKTIIGSGDLFTPQACLEMLAQTGVDGVSIARGAIGNPWIFSRSLALFAGRPLPAPPGVREQRDVIREHRELAEQHYGAGAWLGMLRKFCFKYARLHPRHEDLRNALGAVRSAADWERLIEEFYRDDLPGVEPDEESPESSVQGSKPADA